MTGENIKDNELIKRTKSGDLKAQEEIINKYRAMVKEKTKIFYIKGADRDDLIQEGMIGLLKAIASYNEDKNASFATFADLCVTRQIISVIRNSERKKNIPLNSYISLYKQSEDSDGEFIETITDNKFISPEDIVIGKEYVTFMENYINDSLSKMECKVLYLHLSGKSYKEIGDLLSKNEKSIDNAIQRIRKKIEKAIMLKQDKENLKL